MRTKYFFPKIVLTSLFLFIFSTSFAQFENWDKDRDEKISETEFSEGIFSDGKHDYGLFDGDDKDAKGLSELKYDDNQFYKLSYGWWDKDNDQKLDKTEWDFGFKNSLGDFLDEDFDVYDADSDGYLSYEEYYDSVYETDYYSSWDRNNDDILDYDEYSAGLFDTWDINDDSYVDEHEYDEYGM